MTQKYIHIDNFKKLIMLTKYKKLIKALKTSSLKDICSLIIQASESKPKVVSEKSMHGIFIGLENIPYLN